MAIHKRNGKTFSGTPTRVDTAKSYTTFTSKDAANPDSWEDVELLASKEEQQSLFSKISTMFKNIRYLYKVLGSTDISAIGDGTLTGAVSEINENLGKYEGAETLGNIDVLSYFENEAPNGISVLQIGGAVNAYSTVQSWFTFYKMPSYGRIEQRPINSDMIFVKYMSVDTWSDWDELATNSDLVVVELPALSMNIQPNTDTYLGSVSIPSGYMVVSTDYIPDHSAGGTGWGSLILHTTSGGTIYGMSLATVTNSSGVIRVLCKKI